MQYNKRYFEKTKNKIKYNFIISQLYEQMNNDEEFTRLFNKTFSKKLQFAFDSDFTRPLQLKDNIVFRKQRNVDSLEVPMKDNWEKNASSIRSCARYWQLDYYKQQKLKDIKTVSFCHDKFCPHCQKLLSVARQKKYSGVLDELSKENSIYHVVFTVPNVEGIILRETIDKLFKTFAKLIRYFQNTKKIKGLDFKQYGYVGGIRALEITLDETDLYHPHLHTLFIFKKSPDKNRKHINKYSFDKRGFRVKRKFTDFEILLQKIWFLLWNSQKVTLTNIENLNLGYSVTADDAKGNYHEIFKYAVKGLFKDNSEIEYKIFKTLYFSLYFKKVIQGYGVLNKCKFDSEEDLLYKEVETDYYEFIALLQKIELPIEENLSIDELCNDKEVVKYFSKNKIKTFLDAYNEDK